MVTNALPPELSVEIAGVQARIRAQPAEPKWRMGLFQRYCQTGNWQKAGEQLQTWGSLAGENTAFAGAYQMVLEQEQLRERVFRGEEPAPLPADAEDWLRTLAAMLAADSGSLPDAPERKADALEQAPAYSGSLDGEPFEWIADADTRLGPVCEAVLDGRYRWIPYSSIASIRIQAPTSLCDLIWLPAGIALRGEEPRPALIPARYPLAGGLTDAHLRSALTTWEQHEAEWIGHGVKMLATNREDKSLLDIRRIDFD